MKKQQELKEHRNYQANPRRGDEPHDVDYRSDMSFEGDVSLTKQSEAESCDINNIMKKYEATGLLPTFEGRQPQYGDFASMASFQESLAIVAEAQSMFMGMPAEVRARFQNDPAQFLGYIEKAQTDKDAAGELIKMGLAIPREENAADVLKDIRENTRRVQKTKHAPNSGASNEEED